MEGTRYTASPGTPSGSLLVATTRSLGLAASSAAVSRPAAARRCSQLSISSSTWREAAHATERVEQHPSRFLADAKHPGNGGGDQLGVGKPGEVDQPHAIAMAVELGRRELDREP